MEDYFERVVGTLTGAGYRWYETANFCRTHADRDLRARHNLGYWLGRDYLGIGVGAVSTVGGLRWRNTPGLPRYLAALGRGERPQRELEQLDPGRQRASASCSASASTSRSGSTGSPPSSIATPSSASSGTASSKPRARRSRSRARGRFLGGGVTAELLVEIKAFLQMAEISERKREILRRVVEVYVATGEPVGSKTLVERSGLPVSSSTVRNELAELESLGLLTTRTPPPAGSRPMPATASTPRAARAAGAATGTFPLDLTSMRERGRAGAPVDDRDAGQVTRLLALVSAPGSRRRRCATSRCCCCSRRSSWS